MRRKVSTMRKFSILCASLILVIIAFFIFDAKKKVLILHSYNRDYTWVNQQDMGIATAFKNSYHKIIVKVMYMDLKNHQDKEFRTKAALEAHALIKEYRPDVIIITDDIGQELVGSKYVNDPFISIVFAGVNGQVDKYGYDKANNVTGIFERKPLVAIKETLLMMADTLQIPDKRARVVFASDTSQSVLQELDQFTSFNWSPLEFLPIVRSDNFTEWKSNIIRANTYADIIVVSDYREFKNPDGTKEKIEPAMIMAWTEQNSKCPILGMSLINVFDGGMVSVFNSGYEQGEVAGRKALEIINGKKAGDIDRVTVNGFLTSVRKSAVGQRNFPLPKMYIEWSKESGNYYE